MARIEPVNRSSVPEDTEASFKLHVEKYNARITNMKATLGHSLVAFEAYMQWYPLYREVEKIVGKRLAYLYAYSISKQADCPLCSTFFRKIIIDAGEKPESLQITPDEQAVLNFGNAVVRNHGNINNDVYVGLAEKYSNREMVILIAFAGQMIATNIFNNVVETDIDEYLMDYLPGIKQTG